MIVAINPEYDNISKQSYIHTISKMFGEKYKEIDSINKINNDKPIIIFHPSKDVNIPQWVNVECFNEFDFPEAYYVFGSDYGYLMNDIDNLPEYIKNKIRVVKIPVLHDETKSMHSHQAAAIVLWEKHRSRKDLY